MPDLPAAPRINPSILAADFVNMEAELARIGAADYVHVDVMDNHFVPNLTFGPQMVERILAQKFRGTDDALVLACKILDDDEG